MQKNLKKIVVVQNEKEPMRTIGTFLENTEGYEVLTISENKEAILEALNNSTVHSVLVDLKNDNGSYHILKKSNPAEDFLTVREEEIITLLDKGYLYKEIAEFMDVTLGTLKQYIHIIYEKMGVSNKTEAINKFYSRHDLTKIRYEI